MGLNPGVVF